MNMFSSEGEFYLENCIDLMLMEFYVDLVLMHSLHSLIHESMSSLGDSLFLLQTYRNRFKYIFLYIEQYSKFHSVTYKNQFLDLTYRLNFFLGKL